MLILGLHSGYHDACACVFDGYALKASVAQERLTRRKSDGGRIPTEAIGECLAIAGIGPGDIDLVALSHAAFPARYYTHLRGARALERGARRLLGREKQKTMERELPRAGTADAASIFASAAFLADHGLRADAQIHFYNHHLAHALPCLFHTDWSEALLYTADGGGDNVQYSQRVFRNGAIETLYGGNECLLEPLRIDSLGLAYGYATQALGWRINRHEGKLTGLAAYGSPRLLEKLAPRFTVDDDGHVCSDFESNPAMRRFIFELTDGVAREDVAASFQQLLEDVALSAIGRFLQRYPVRNLGLAGGIFANVRLNRLLAEELPIDEIFVYPAMSDQGLACGGVLDALLARDGLETWLANRWPLEHLYYGRDAGGDIDRHFEEHAGIAMVSATPVETTAELLAQGRIVAIYSRAMEYGPRALGARSILASPADAAVNQSLNERLERSEFMPFAPVVAREDASEVFELSPATLYTARFMTITCGVKEQWREKIPAVVHIDGTARPQVIERPANPLYYDILAAFKARTGLPVMVNTSFNVHEEPIINTPAECAKALTDKRIDFVVTDQGVYGAGRG